MKTTDPFMIRAIELAAKAGLGERGGGCFGAVVVRNGEVVGEGYNRVLTRMDPTAHGEMEAIRNACKYLQTHILADCTLYTSSEPCPMCMCAAGDYGGFDDVAFYEKVMNKTVAESICDHGARDDMRELWEKYRAIKPVLY